MRENAYQKNSEYKHFLCSDAEVFILTELNLLWNIMYYLEAQFGSYPQPS